MLTYPSGLAGYQEPKNSIIAVNSSSENVHGLASLPDELLEQIFTFVGGTNYDSQRRWMDSLRQALILSSVSRQFRDVSVTMPHLWNTLDNRGEMKEELVSMLLDRCKRTGVSLVLRDFSAEYEALLAQACEHVVSLAFAGWPEDLWSHICGIFGHASVASDGDGQRLSLPRLRSLSIVNPAGSGQDMFIELYDSPVLLSRISELAPNLAKVALRNVVLPESLPGSVDEVQIRCEAEYSEFVLRRISTMAHHHRKVHFSIGLGPLGGKRKYEAWRCKFSTQTNVVERVSWWMTSLRVRCDDITADFSSFDFPSLEKLCVEVKLLESKLVGEGGDDAVRWGHVLRKFFTDIDGSPKAFPCLEEVKLVCCRVDDGKTGARTGVERMDGPHPIVITGSLFDQCPKLDTLEISIIDTIPGDIVDFKLPPNGIGTLRLTNCLLAEDTFNTLRGFMGIQPEDGSASGERLVRELVISNCVLPKSGVDLVNNKDGNLERDV